MPFAEPPVTMMSSNASSCAAPAQGIRGCGPESRHGERHRGSPGGSCAITSRTPRSKKRCAESCGRSCAMRGDIPGVHEPRPPAPEASLDQRARQEWHDSPAHPSSLSGTREGPASGCVRIGAAHPTPRRILDRVDALDHFRYEARRPTHAIMTAIPRQYSKKPERMAQFPDTLDRSWAMRRREQPNPRQNSTMMSLPNFNPATSAAAWRIALLS